VSRFVWRRPRADADIVLAPDLMLEMKNEAMGLWISARGKSLYGQWNGLRPLSLHQNFRVHCP
jgi:hypothetical protein